MASVRMAMTMKTRIGVAALVAYVFTIFAANWLIVHVGLVHVWWTGLLAPAGVYAVGFALIFRDIVQTTLGRWPVVGAILVGAALSYLIAPGFAAASAVAFLASESADFAVYTPLEERQWYAAVAVSNVVGAVVDSMLFLALAFGSLDLLAGQVVGKLSMTALALPFLIWTRRALLARHA